MFTFWQKELFDWVAWAMQPVCDSYYGREHLGQNTKPPRCVWVRSDDVYEPAKQQGANPRVIKTELSHLELHCWGMNELQAEQIKTAAVSALDMVCSVVEAFMTCEIEPVRTSHDLNDNQVTNLGYKIVLLVAFKHPIYAVTQTNPVADNVRATVQPETVGFDTTGEVDGDGEIYLPDM